MQTIARFTLGVSMAALLAFGMAGAAAASEMVVLDAKGASMEKGTVIDGSKPITLSAGAKLTLMGADGSPISIEGPFTGKPADKAKGGGDPKTVNALAALFAGQKKSTASLGAVRAGSAQEDVTLPQPWVISVDQSGARCIQKGATQLYRADSSKETTLSLTGGYKSIKNAAWQAGQSTVTLPDNFFADGKAYKASVGTKAVDLTIHVMPADKKAPGEIAAWMAEKGCTPQAMAMLTSVAK